MKSKILLIGVGRMGGAILRTLTDGQKYQIFAADPIFAQQENTKFNAKIEFYTGIKQAIKAKTDFDIIILGFKPQFFPSLADNIRKLVRKKTLIISIMAGISLKTIRSSLGNKTRVVRTMPNIAATVGYSVTAFYGENDIDKQHKQIVENIFSRLGKFYWLDDEEYMHIVTALSGSGPAYYYAFCDILAQIAADMGLPEDLANQFSIDTMIGAAKVLEKQRQPRKLRDSVTSQGGTTQAALDILLQPEALARLARMTLAAAAERSRELSI